MAIDTATDACSVALFDGDRAVATAHEVAARGHAERLMPLIAALPDGGRADAILVDRGPGSFTGVRVGLAAARGLALGWGVPVDGYSALALLAAMTHAQIPALDRVAVVLEGGHGEVFMQFFRLSPMVPVGVAESLPPAAAVIRLGDTLAVGSGVAKLTSIAPQLTTRYLLPDAACVMMLPAPLRADASSPLYGRAPDAKLPA